MSIISKGEKNGLACARYIKHTQTFVLYTTYKGNKPLWGQCNFGFPAGRHKLNKSFYEQQYTCISTDSVSATLCYWMTSSTSSPKTNLEKLNSVIKLPHAVNCTTPLFILQRINCIWGLYQSLFINKAIF